ncbi:conserved Plasmodium protein, unknown function [Plasmodium ovale wallikeri]|uniref:Uncharacterized protein n=1 Tax=Plasmodium ovale wallikeri TaxID=864142 RepID=A0A1A8YUQ3_PLAOA|nr:conserved Plasmodium protein, unknown function [Plasmodium ovale wallikeri]SBT35719.1 conserved Plasmodium protein, unknown function [Plasmodium ovale wallikeri]
MQNINLDNAISQNCSEAAQNIDCAKEQSESENEKGKKGVCDEKGTCNENRVHGENRDHSEYGKKNSLPNQSASRQIAWPGGDNNMINSNEVQIDREIRDTSNNMHPAGVSSFPLSNRNISKQFLDSKNESNTEKSLEEAVNRRRKIKEMILAYNSLNLSLSSCNFENLYIRKKTSLYQSDYSGEKDDPNETKYKKKLSERNYLDITNEMQDKKEIHYICDNGRNYENINRNHHVDHISNSYSRNYKNNSSQNMNNNLGNYYNSKDNIKSRVSEMSFEKFRLSSNSENDDDIEDYKTFLTLDSNQTIFKAKPLKLPDISFLNSSSRSYNNNVNGEKGTCNGSGNDNHNHNDNHNNSGNYVLRNRILYEKLDGLSFFCDEEGEDDRKKLNYNPEQNGEKYSAQHKITGMCEYSNKHFLEKNVNIFELKENKSNIVKNYTNINRVENSNIERLINLRNVRHASHMNDQGGEANRSTKDVRNKTTACTNAFLSEEKYSNSRIIYKNAFENNYFKNYVVTNSFSKTKDIKNNIMYNNFGKEKNEKDNRYCVDRIRNSSIIYPYPSSSSKPNDTCSGVEKYNTYNNVVKYENVDNKHAYDKNSFIHEDETYVQFSHVKDVENFKEVLKNVTKYNLNEYVKCLQNINNKKLKHYQYYIKQVNNYNISHYLNETFKASTPVKNIKESVLNNSDTFSSLHKSAIGSDELSTTTHSESASSAQLVSRRVARGSICSRDGRSISSNCSRGSATKWSSKVYENGRKCNAEYANALETASDNRFSHSCIKMKNEGNLCLVRRKKKKKIVIRGKSSSHDHLNSVRCKIKTSVVRNSQLPHNTQNSFYRHVDKLDKMSKKKKKFNRGNIVDDSFKSKCTYENLKEKQIYEQSLRKGKMYIMPNDLSNIDYANNCKSRFNKKETTHLLKKKKKKDNFSNSCNKNIVYHSKNKRNKFFPFNTDSEDYNSDHLNNASISIAQNNSIEKKYSQSFNEDLSHRKTDDVHVTSISIYSDINDKGGNEGEDKFGYSIDVSGYTNDIEPGISENNSYYTEDESLGQSFHNCTGKSGNKYILCNVSQDSAHENNEFHLSDIKASAGECTYSCREEIGRHERKEEQGNVPSGECANALSSQRDNRMNNLCLIEKSPASYDANSVKLHKENYMREEYTNAQFKKHDLGKNGNLVYLTEVDRNEKRNSLEDEQADHMTRNVKRECNFNINELFLDKKEKDISKYTNNDVLNFNVQKCSKNNEKFRKDQVDVPDGIQQNDHYDFRQIVYVNKNEGVDISDIIKNNRTRIENLYASEPSQSDLCGSDHMNEFNHSIGKKMGEMTVVKEGECMRTQEGARTNERMYGNVEGKEHAWSPPHKFNNLYNSESENSYSINSYKEEMEDRNIIKYSLDSFNEEFENVVSVPTPAASIFSDVSLCSPPDRNKKKQNSFTLNGNNTEDIDAVYKNRIDNEENMVTKNKFERVNLLHKENVHPSKNNIILTYPYSKNNEVHRMINSENENNTDHNMYQKDDLKHANKSKNGKLSYDNIIHCNKKYDELSSRSVHSPTQMANTQGLGKLTQLREKGVENGAQSDNCFNNGEKDHVNGDYRTYDTHADHGNHYHHGNHGNHYHHGNHGNRSNAEGDASTSENSLHNRKSINNSVITNNIDNVDKMLIYRNKDLIMEKKYKEMYQSDKHTFSNTNSSESLKNNLTKLLELKLDDNKIGINRKYIIHNIVNTLEIKETKINTKQGIFEITSSGEVIFTFLGRSEIREYKNVKNKIYINIDISKPRKLLFIIDTNGINIKIKDVLTNNILDFYNLFEEELPKTHKVRYDYAYDVVETLKKHTPKVSLTKKRLGIYNLMSNGSTPDFMAILSNNMYIDKVEVKNNNVAFILKDRNTITIHIDDLNGVTTKFTKTMRRRENTNGKHHGQYSEQCPENHWEEALFKELTGGDEEIKAVLLNLQTLLKGTGISIDIIIQNWCSTLQAYSQCLRLLTKGNDEYMLKLKKTLSYITEKTEIQKRTIYFSIFPIVIEE